MQSVLLVAATLACPVGMGLMMWMMMRGHGSTHQTVNPVNEHAGNGLNFGGSSWRGIPHRAAWELGSSTSTRL
jgi:hypothetical protein